MAKVSQPDVFSPGFNDVVYCQNIRHSAKELDRFMKSGKDVPPSFNQSSVSNDGAGVVAIPKVSYSLGENNQTDEKQQMETRIA